MSDLAALLKDCLAKYAAPDDAYRDIFEAMQHYRDLKPSLDSYVFNDGTVQVLVQLEGTIPVPFRGNRYNIPVQLWLLNTHPYNPPVVYVRPTKTMLIRAGSYVDSNGKVDLPYLQTWEWPKFCLLGLIQILTVAFGEECPVFSKVPSQRRSPERQHSQQDQGCQTSFCTMPTQVQEDTNSNPGPMHLTPIQKQAHTDPPNKNMDY